MITDSAKSIEVQTKVLGSLRARVYRVFFLGGVQDTGVPDELLEELHDMLNEYVVELFRERIPAAVSALVHDTEDDEELDSVITEWLKADASPRGFVLCVEAMQHSSWDNVQRFHAYGDTFEDGLSVVVEAVSSWRDKDGA